MNISESRELVTDQSCEELKAANFDDLYIETETVRQFYLNNEKSSGFDVKKKKIQMSPDISRVND